MKLRVALGMPALLLVGIVACVFTSRPIIPADDGGAGDDTSNNDGVCQPNRGTGQGGDAGFSFSESHRSCIPVSSPSDAGRWDAIPGTDAPPSADVGPPPSDRASDGDVTSEAGTDAEDVAADGDGGNS